MPLHSCDNSHKWILGSREGRKEDFKEDPGTAAPSPQIVTAHVITFYLRPNQELYKNVEISITMKEKRTTFYGPLRRVKLKTIANKILNFRKNRGTYIPRVKQVDKGLGGVGSGKKI